MEIKEAINVFKKKHACLKQFKTNLNKCDCILMYIPLLLEIMFLYG